MAELVVIEGTLPAGFRMELDASVAESHRRQLEVTKHPVETGSDVTDHVRFAAREIDIVGIVSNTPLGDSIGRPAVAGGDPARRAESAFEALERLQQTGTLCSITTTLVTYANMVLSALTVARDASRGNIAELQMTWTEIRYVETLRVELPTKQKKLGKQGTTDATDKQKAEMVSVIKQTASKAVAALFGG